MFPVSGFEFILNQIQKIAERELNDESVIKEQLLELQMRLELGQVSDEDFSVEESELFRRLRAIKEKQLESMHQIHSAASSSMVVEVPDDDEDAFLAGSPSE
jgi:hypothetical protein